MDRFTPFTHPLATLKPTFLDLCLIFWLSHFPKTPLSGLFTVYHVSCTTLIRHRPILICMLYLRFRQHSSSTCARPNSTLQISITSGLGTPPSAVVWATLPLKPLIMFLSSALPFLRLRGLICGLWCKRRATFYQQSRLVWGRPSAPLLTASSVMMQMFGRRFTPCIILESYRHSL